MHRQDDERILERALRRTLSREEAPDGFTGRVMAVISEATTRDAETKSGPFRWLSPRLTLALAGGACAAGVFLMTSGLPGPPAEDSEQAALDGAAQELAEVLHMTGDKWNQARDAAFPARLDGNDE